MLMIGIDGGGTQSRAVLCDESGEVYAYAQAGPVNQNSVSLSKVEEAFQQLSQGLERQSPDRFQKVTYVFAGIAGTGDENGRLRIQEMLAPLFTQATVEVQHDGYNALFAGTLGQSGVVQIAGTGSLTFGVNEQDEAARAGGWGYLIGDEGSGYALGRDALSAVAKAADGWGESTLLTRYLLNHFEVSEPHELIPHIYSQEHPRHHIAELSRYVTEAALHNDLVAQVIIQKAGKELADQIIAVIKRLWRDTETPVPVVLTGGVFSIADLFLPSIEQTFDQQKIKARLIQPELSPLGGAALAACRALHIDVSPTFASQFNQSKEEL